MKKARGVMNSDTVNRYNQRFTAGALCDALVDTHFPGIPSLVSHDFTRPLGWTQTTAVHFEPGCTRLLGETMFPETDEDFELARGRFAAAYAEDIRKIEAELSELKALIAGGLADDAVPLPAECVAFHGFGLARRVAGDIFAKEDDDGLVDVSLLDMIGPGVFRYDRLALFAHSFFRRSFSPRNGLNTAFLRRLLELDGSRTKARIKLDPDVIGLASTLRERIELEYWWGPKFDDDITAIAPGITRHEATETQRLFHALSRTEFWWKTRDGEHTLEAEELRDRPTFTWTPHHEEYGCRYVHSIVQSSDCKIHHFDGAVRMYVDTRMVERLDQTIAEVRRDLPYTKLWRIDGDVKIAEWKDLLTHYFRDNPLVGEYLGAAAERESTPTVEPEGVQQAGSAVGRKLGPADGVRLTISLGDRDVAGARPADVVLEPTIFHQVEGSARDVVETWAYELAKVLRREGLDAHLPPVDSISPKDRYVNLPIIRVIRRDDLTVTMPKVREGLKRFLAGLESQIPDSVVAAHISFPFRADLRARISVLAHVKPFLTWLDEPLAVPTDFDDLNAWGTAVAERLAAMFPAGGDFPSVFDVVNRTGLLELRRLTFENAPFTLGRQGENVVAVKLAIPRTHSHVADAVEAGQLAAAVAFEPKVMTCSRCTTDFRACACSKFLDGATVTVERADVAFAFVTDRPLA